MSCSLHLHRGDGYSKSIKQKRKECFTQLLVIFEIGGYHEA